MPLHPHARRHPATRLAGALLLAALAAVGSRAWAHGGPVKVVEDRFVVTAVLFPAGDGTRLRLFFRDFQSGQVPTDVLSFQIRIRADGSRAVICESPVAAVESGQANAFCRTPHDGFYEVFLQFWLDREPERVYQPEDWRVWIGGAGTSPGWPSTVVVTTVAVALGAIGVVRWRRPNPEGDVP